MYLPCQVRESTVSGTSDHFTINSSKLICSVRERNYFRWTHKRTIKKGDAMLDTQMYYKERRCNVGHTNVL